MQVMDLILYVLVAYYTALAALNPQQYNANEAAHAGVFTNSRFSNAPSEASLVTSNPSYEKQPIPVPATPPMPMPVPTTQSMPQYLYDKDPDLDDALHDPKPDPKFDSCTIFSARGWVNVLTLVVIVVGLVTLFAGYPIIWFFAHPRRIGPGFNVGGINASGQIPDLRIPSLIDADTPSNVYSRTGNDGKKYSLVFSDEFEMEGRTFYPGDDPYWEAADLHYWCAYFKFP